MSRETELQESAPWIRWREPIRISMIATPEDVRFGCRFCIAIKGITGPKIVELPRTREEFENHMIVEHPL